MATTAFSSQMPTLLDVLKTLAPNGSVETQIIEALSQSNPILQDAVFTEGNLPTGHRVTTRTSLPAPTYRRFNEGVSASKGTTGQVDETCCMLDGLSKVDVALAKFNGDAGAYRMTQEVAFMQGYSNELERGFIYNSTKANPERMQGFTPRMDSTTGPAGKQIILADPSASGSDQTSIWLIGWGPNTVHGIYPKGSKAGLERDDRGEQLLPDDITGKTMRVYATYYSWSWGLAVEDWRYMVRIANVDTSNLSATADIIIPAMIQAVGQMKDLVNCRPAFYVNRTVRTYLALQARNATKNSTLSLDTIDGKPVMSFQGIPVRMSDAITTTESVVS